MKASKAILSFFVDTGTHMGSQQGPPPSSGGDSTSDHPDLYVPEPVRHFLPYFYQKFKEKVCIMECWVRNLTRKSAPSAGISLQ